jgi:hypothetical protein
LGISDDICIGWDWGRSEIPLGLKAIRNDKFFGEMRGWMGRS